MYHHFDMAVWKCCVVSVYLSCRKAPSLWETDMLFQIWNERSLSHQTNQRLKHNCKRTQCFSNLKDHPSRAPPISSSLSYNKPEAKPYLSKDMMLFLSVMLSSKYSHVFVTFSVVTWPSDREREDVPLSCSRTSTTQAMATNAALLP